MNYKAVNKIAELAKTDQKAFSSIYEIFYDKIYNYVRWNVTSNEVAQDLVSDVFFKVINNIHSYNSNYYFSTWIFTITRNTLKDFFKKKKMETYTIEQEETQPSKDESMEKNIERQSYINNLLKSLKEEEREIISLKYFGELNIEEISSLLDIPTKTVYTKISRGLKKLSKISEKE